MKVGDIYLFNHKYGVVNDCYKRNMRVRITHMNESSSWVRVAREEGRVAFNALKSELTPIEPVCIMQ